MKTREIKQVVPARATSDGAGVQLYRSLGGSPMVRLDPWLMLDEFSSSEADDYRGGFPPHPHRGFETITYMLAGRMRHEDHLGNQGVLGPGGVQWMTAGRGIVHSEMPEQEQGEMHGFQLWLNLPASDKMQEPRWQDFAPEALPSVELSEGVQAKIIAGRLNGPDGEVSGPGKSAPTDPHYFDLSLEPGTTATLPLPATHNALLYLFAGQVRIGERELSERAAVLLGDGEAVQLHNPGDDTLRVLLIAGRPIGEPIVQHGPFVMSSTEEIRQTLRDHAEGLLTTGR